jgi:hypothetical protein
MKINLFDMKNGRLVPGKHLERMNSFINIKDRLSDDDEWEGIFLWAHYMTYPYPEENPYSNTDMLDRSEKIVDELGISEPVDFDEDCQKLKNRLEELYSTPVTRAYKGLAALSDKMSKHLETTDIKDGKDGNVVQLTGYASKYKAIRDSFKLAEKDLEDESKAKHLGRGNTRLAYDQD